MAKKLGSNNKPLPPGASSRSGTAPPAKYRWKKGKSGNPNGRPSNPKSITYLLRQTDQWPATQVKTLFEWFETKRFKIPVEMRTIELATVLRIQRMCVAGDVHMIREKLSRLEGRPPEGPFISDEGGEEPPAVIRGDPYKLVVGLLKEMVNKGVIPAQVFMQINQGGGNNGGDPG